MDRRRLLGLAGGGLVGAGVAVALSEPLAAQAPQPRPAGPIDIVVRSFPIDAFKAQEPDRRQFGPFEFRGGLELQSDYRGFGGLSALRMEGPGDRLVAVSDRGQWLTARVTMEGPRLAGLTQARMAPILGANGRPLGQTGNWDAESLWIEGGTAYVGVERTHRIFRFDTFGREGVLARGTAIPVPMGDNRLPGNAGIEALGVLPKPSPLAGTLIAISERGLNEAGDIRGFLMGTGRSSEFTVKRTNDFDVTDLAFLPNGDMLLLERWFSLWRGVAFRIRRIDLATIRTGAVLDGPIVLSADMSAQIDNMEGIAVHRSPEGETIVSLISDNNFSFLQRTLLLQFAWKG